MKSFTSLAVALAAGLLAVTPALAQDTTKPNGANSSGTMSNSSGTMGNSSGTTKTSKQPTQGAPAGFQPQQYGATAKKQPTQGAPAGYEPQKYGSVPAAKNQ
jgi:hypothetical protein